MNTGKKEIVRPPSKGRRRGTPSIDGRRFLYPNLLGEAAFFPEAPAAGSRGGKSGLGTPDGVLFLWTGDACLFSRVRGFRDRPRRIYLWLESG